MKLKFSTAMLLSFVFLLSCKRNVEEPSVNIEQVNHDLTATATSVSLSTASSLAIKFLQDRTLGYVMVLTNFF